MSTGTYKISVVLLYKVPLGDVGDLKSRGFPRLKTEETSGPTMTCVKSYVSFAAAAVLLLVGCL